MKLVATRILGRQRSRRLFYNIVAAAFRLAALSGYHGRMKRSVPLRFAALAALTLLIPKALSMNQTNAFASKPAGRVAYDGSTRTWTLSNAAVSRSVRFDPKTGGLAPVGLALNGSPAAVKVVSEGSVTLVSPMKALPEVVSSAWRFSNTEPAPSWNEAGFDDSSWTPMDLPFTSNDPNRSWWFRYAVPAGRLRAGVKYAIVLDHAADDGAEVWADGKHIGSLPPSSVPWNKTFQFPLPVDTRVIAIRLDGGGAPNSLKNVSIAEAGEERTLDLAKGWTLQGHSEHGDTLTLSLAGVGVNAGFEVDVTHRVMPGNEPVVTKQITVHSATPDQYLVKEAVLDEIEARDPITATQAFTGAGTALASGGGGGVVASALALMGSTEVSGSRMKTVYRPFTPISPDGRFTSPEAMLGLYNGPTNKGGLLLQLYVGAHVSHGTPTTVPPLYSTWFGYYNSIDGALVESLVPKAAELGVKYFSIDDGWQGIDGRPGRGYGDWIENKEFFPNGLKPIADSVRKHGMKFGLWTAPIMVHNNSAVSEAHPEWKIRHADGSPLPLWDGTSAECFSGAYADHFKQTLLGLCKDYDLKFLKLDGGLFEDGCAAPGHSHPLLHSVGAQFEAWKDLCATLRKEVPGVVIDRGWEGEPGLTALQDTSWYGDWIIAFRPEREADIRWWYRNADNYRRFLYGITFSRPPFTISWEAPCHILAKPGDLNALEYHLTSVGAYICNLEIHGRILEMTPEEENITKKWVKWNWDNREFLAVTQPIVSLGQPYDALSEKDVPHVDGVMHLRNPIKGRYGYVCLWNPSDKPATADVVIRPSDCFVKMDTSRVALTRLKDGSPIASERTADAITLHVPMGAFGWEIVDVTQPAA